MEVEVVYGLTTPATDVRDQPKATICDAFAAGQIRSDLEQATEERAVRLGQLQRRPDVAPGHEQDVGRSAGRDVPKRDDQVVRVKEVGRHRTLGDTAEQAADRRPRHIVAVRHHSIGFELIRKPIVPTRPAIRYDT
jgi:hypothetical protein